MTRIVVRQVNWLGDLVMSLPATRSLREAFPEASITILVKRELASFYDGAEWIDEVMSFRVERGWRGVADQISLIRQLRQRRFDTAVIFPRSFSSALWMAAARIPRRIGYAADGRRLLLTDAYEYAGDFLQHHQVNDHLELVRRAFGIEGNPDALQIPVSAGNRERMRAWLAERRRRSGTLIAMAVAAAFGPAKEWPADSYAELIDRLAADGAECVLVGAPSERERCAAVAAASRTGALVAAGETSVGELAALLSQCDAFVGNDSGAMHVAAALGLPTVGIFGSTRAWRTGPRGPRATVVRYPIECSPCMDRRCRFGHYDCLRSISAADVSRALAGVLALSPG